MAVVIAGVEKNSPADKNGIFAGETLISINGNEINDILDYRFYETSEDVELLLIGKDGCEHWVSIHKGEYSPLGLEFDTYLMDKQRSCKNKCIFCFIDQLPKGMRESLYFKDDDSRLSFLFGNYITLTNVTEKEIDRIIKMHISPVNISIHTTNPELRVKMMKNPHAGESLKYIKKLADANIRMNCQLVLCPGINDGKELEKSLHDIALLGDCVESVALVPLGMTKHREGLTPLVGYDKETAGNVIDIAERYGDEQLKKTGRRLFFPADEFYIKAGREIPDYGFYEDFAQIENGVGMIASLKDEFLSAVEDLEADDRHRKLTIATGESAAKFIQNFLDVAKEKWHNLECEVVPIKNIFFGETINVAGLVTGGDLISQLKGRDLGERLLFPDVMLRHEGDLFLDNVSVEDVERELNVSAIPVASDGYELLEAILGEVKRSCE